MTLSLLLDRCKCVAPTCETVLALDRVRAGCYLCGPCSGSNGVRLTADDALELELSMPAREFLGLDPALYFECGHARTKENTRRERTGRKDNKGNRRLNPDGSPETRERCRTCKDGADADRDRAAAA